MHEIDQLLEIMDALRDPETGCPWDREQTITTIMAYTLEEVYELVDAIESGDMGAMQDELGDLLFHIVYYARLAGESGHFVFSDIVRHLNDKLKRRHPHVFGGDKVDNVADEFYARERIKHREKSMSSSTPPGLLNDVNKSLPALIQATKLQKKAASVGFDWDQVSLVMAKIEEELAEICEAILDKHDIDSLRDETGDLLFACVNLARHLNVDPESALMSTNRKFRRRFSYIESQLAVSGRSLEETDLDEMEILWRQARNNEKAD